MTDAEKGTMKTDPGNIVTAQRTKSLILLRHAKSDQTPVPGGDHERPLKPRGRRAAHAVGRFLAALGEVPDAVLTSSAVRARTTVELAAAAGRWRAPITVVRELYDADPDGVLALLRRQDDARRSLLLAGHEPTWSSLASRLIGGGRLDVVTAALVRIDLGVDRWSDLAFGRGVLTWLVPPRLLQRAGLDED